MRQAQIQHAGHASDAYREPVLTAWRTYLRVVHLGSISAAADELGYTQSAISRQVATLEQAVGVPLLTRHARGVVPTEAGEAFAHHARVVVSEADRAVHAARTARGEAHPLVIGATPSLAAGVLPVALRDGPSPWTLLPALTAELRPRVLAGEIDVAFVTDAPPGLPETPGLERHPVGTDAMCVLVAHDHPAAAEGTVSLGRFATERWVEDNEGSAALLRGQAARAGFEARIELTAADLVGKIALVAAGHAVALVPGVLAGSLRRDVVAVRLLDAPTRGIFAITQPGRADQLPGVRELVERVTAAL